jgi:hypothetical protein
LEKLTRPSAGEDITNTEGEMPEATTPVTRTRINVKQSAKGDVQFDVTAEAPTPEEAQAMLEEAINKVRATCDQKGLRLAG